MMEKQIIVDGLLTKYSEQGNGKKIVVCLHGWGDNAKTYGSLSFDQDVYKVISINLPGFGGSDRPRMPWGLTDYATFVQMFVKKLNIELYAIIGHSNGGAIAIRGVSLGLLKTSKLILLASSGVRDIFKTRKYVLRLSAKVAKVATKPLPKRLQNRIKRRAYDTIGSDLFVSEGMKETFKKIVSDDVTDDTSNISVPTLLIYGQNDQATPPSFGKLFASNISGSKLKVIPDAGHFVHVDVPDQVNELIKEFLQ